MEKETARREPIMLAPRTIWQLAWSARVNNAG